MLPGAEVKIRRTSEKKLRWGDTTATQGVFAIRVPKGDQYEIRVRAKGFADMTRSVDARTGDREDMTFRMQRAEKGKSK